MGKKAWGLGGLLALMGMHALAADSPAPSAAASAADPTIKDFLVDLSGGYVGAAGIINLSDKLVTSVATPKDLVVAVGASGGSQSQDGFGIAFAPGRFAWDSTSIRMADYAKVGAQNAQQLMGPYSGEPLRRLWAGTTFSYAQNKLEQANVKYDQQAYAVHLAYYPNPLEDPVVAAYRMVTGDTIQSADNQVKGTDGKTERERLLESSPKCKAWRDLVGPKDADKGALKASAKARRTKAVVSNAQSEEDAAKAESAARACAAEAQAAAESKWNATKVMLLVGKGTIKGPNATDAKLSLGRHLQLAVAASPGALGNSLFNLTLRKSWDVLDTSSLGAAPVYNSGSLWAARYTLNQGEGYDMYWLAEVSDVRKKTAALASGAFKYALGFDRKIAAGTWLEFRVGRSQSVAGDKQDNKALFNLKFSPESELSKLK